MKYPQTQEEIEWGDVPIDSEEYERRIERERKLREKYAKTRREAPPSDDDSWGESNFQAC